MRIDRCICFSRTFAELKVVAEATGADSVRALQEHIRFGDNCQLCHPYVREMLRSGEVVFRRIIPPDQTEDGDGSSAAG